MLFVSKKLESTEVHNDSINIYYKESELNTLPQIYTNLLYSIRFYCDIIPINLLEIITEKLKINLNHISCLSEDKATLNTYCDCKEPGLKVQCKNRTIEVLYEIRKFFLLLHFFNMTNSETCLFFLNQVECLQNQVLRNCKILTNPH